MMLTKSYLEKRLEGKKVGFSIAWYHPVDRLSPVSVLRLGNDILTRHWGVLIAVKDRKAVLFATNCVATNATLPN